MELRAVFSDQLAITYVKKESIIFSYMYSDCLLDDIEMLMAERISHGN